MADRTRGGGNPRSKATLTVTGLEHPDMEAHACLARAVAASNAREDTHSYSPLQRALGRRIDLDGIFYTPEYEAPPGNNIKRMQDSGVNILRWAKQNPVSRALHLKELGTSYTPGFLKQIFCVHSFHKKNVKMLQHDNPTNNRLVTNKSFKFKAHHKWPRKQILPSKKETRWTTSSEHIDCQQQFLLSFESLRKTVSSTCFLKNLRNSPLFKK